MQPAFEITGFVESVLVASNFGSLESTSVKKIQCILGHGIKGDSHAGARLADVREKSFLSHGHFKGTEISNHRQFSAISIEELAEISRLLELPNQIRHGSLGENLVLSGIPRMTELPPGTLLFFKRGDTIRSAVLYVWGENTPCSAPGEVIQKQFSDIPDVASFFARHAMGKRGIVGGVYASGVIHQGDTVIAKVPAQHVYTPE